MRLRSAAFLLTLCGLEETRLSILERRQETYDNKIEELSRLISSQNNILTEVKVKLDLMCAEKNKRRKNGEQRD